MQTINFDKLNLKKDDLLLDMGCGEGRHTIGAYIEKQVNTFGFDLSYKDLQIAKQRLNDFDVSNKKEICQFGGVLIFFNVFVMLFVGLYWMNPVMHEFISGRPLL